MIQTIITFVVVVLVNVMFSNGQASSGCSNDEELAVLELQLDQNADETGYKLVCDDVTLWDIPIGTLSDQPEGAWKIEHACVPTDVTICNFTISDFGRDGMTGGDNGFFTLSYGATTIAAFEYGKITPFTELSYCFGSGCDSPPMEEKENDENPYGWKAFDFNETTTPLRSNSTEPGENESDSDGKDAGKWVVNVTRPDKDGTDIEFNETGVWEVNVTVKKNDDKNGTSTWVANVTFPKNDDKDDPSFENDIEPNDNSLKPRDETTTPETNDESMTRSEYNSPSASSLVIIASVISAILIGLIVMVILYKRWQLNEVIAERVDDADTTQRAVTHYSHRMSHYGNNVKVDYNEEEDDDEKSKNSNDNVHQAETFVTYDSSENTVVQRV